MTQEHDGDKAALQDAEDSEAAELLDSMIAGEPEQYLRELLAGNSRKRISMYGPAAE